MKTQYGRSAIATLAVLFTLCVGGLSAGDSSLCILRNSQDLAPVSASGYVTNLDISSKGNANFDLWSGACSIHVFWKLPDERPSWLLLGALVNAEGTYWQRHPQHTSEPEIVADRVCRSAPIATTESLPGVLWTWQVIPWGAAGDVAGSCYQVLYQSASVLVDCGSYMNTDDMPTYGSSSSQDPQDWDDFLFDVEAVAALVVTHAHADHVGRIHYLVAAGFRGPIYMTEATASIFRANLDDLIEHSKIPTYNHEAAAATILSLIRTHRYLEPFPVAEGLTAMFVDAYHIPGSASVVLTATTQNGSATATFSGDIGSGHHPFLNQPDSSALRTSGTTTLVVESTYGAGEARTYPKDLYGEFYDAVQSAVDSGKLVVIPAFALDRTQRALAALVDGVAKGRLRLGKPIGVGGKSSCCLTQAYIEMQACPALYGQYFHESYFLGNPFVGADWEFIRLGATSPERPSASSPEEICQACSDPSCEVSADPFQYSVIVTPSGTGVADNSYSAALIEKYRDDERVVFIKVGWAPPWTPMGGDNGPAVVVEVQDVFSGHADVSGLLAYVSSFPDLRHVFITHGDDDLCARRNLAAAIHEVMPSVEIVLPTVGQALPLS